MIVANNIADLIGKTPLVRINSSNQMMQQSMLNSNATTSGFREKIFAMRV